MAETQCGFNDAQGVSGGDLLATYGPTLLVDIGFDATWTAGMLSQIPAPNITQVISLVDTGASECCIDELLAVQLNLPVIDRIPVSGSNGQHEANMYLAQIHIPSLGFTMYGSFAGLHLSAGGQVHKALIGRSFLVGFVMIYDGNTGNVTIKSA